MKKYLHRFHVYGSDDPQVSDFTKWKRYGIYATRGEAWLRLRILMAQKYFRHVKIVEERVYKNLY